MRRIAYESALIKCADHQEEMTIELTIRGNWRAASLFEACPCVGPEMETQEEAALAWGIDYDRL